MTQAALRMKAAQEAEDAEAILSSARLNWQLWTIIQSELLDPDCPVPTDIRQNVLSLANFVDKHMVGIIAGPDPKKLDVLISINRELAGGLYAQPQPSNENDGIEDVPMETATRLETNETSA